MASEREVARFLYAASSAVQAWSAGLISEAEPVDHGAVLSRAAAHRTWDAVHLVSALVARSALSGLGFLALDQRVRENGARMGFVTLS